MQARSEIKPSRKSERCTFVVARHMYTSDIGINIPNDGKHAPHWVSDLMSPRFGDRSGEFGYFHKLIFR